MAGGKIYLASRPRGKKKPATAMRVAKKALKLSKQNIAEVNTQTYANLVSLDLGTNAGGVVHIAPPNSSIGDKIHYMYIDYCILLNQDVTSTAIDTWRCAIVLDRMPTASLPAVSDIYSFNNVGEIVNLPDFADNERYSVVRQYFGSFYEKINVTRNIRGRIKTSLVIEGITGYNIGAIRKNAYYLVFWTDAVTAQPKISYQFNCVVNSS